MPLVEAVPQAQGTVIPRQSRRRSRSAGHGVKQLDVGEVVPQIAAIPRNQTICMDLSVSPNEEVRDNASGFPAASEICCEAGPCQDADLERRRNEFELPIGEELLEGLAAGERRVYLGKYAFTDNKLPLIAGMSQRLFRPVRESRVIDHNVENGRAVHRRDHSRMLAKYASTETPPGSLPFPRHFRKTSSGCTLRATSCP